MIVNGAIAVIIAYLLGSIPSAYIVTRLATGKDIRKLGGGNVGARNVLREVGLGPAIGVGVFDIGKGALAVGIASWLLGGGYLLFVLAAGLAVVVGHIWSIYLKFTGGNGLATTIGVLSVVMTQELLIALALALLFIVVTRNPILSINISFFSVPISAWFLEKSWVFVIFVVILLLVMAPHFVPKIKADLARTGSRANFLAELLRRKKT